MLTMRRGVRRGRGVAMDSLSVVLFVAGLVTWMVIWYQIGYSVATRRAERIRQQEWIDTKNNVRRALGRINARVLFGDEEPRDEVERQMRAREKEKSDEQSA
jgi:hypothetical protein